MAIVETVSYGFIFCITIIFSMMSLFRHIENMNQKIILDWLSPIFDAFAFIGWLILVPLHLAFVGAANAFLSAPAILYFAFGILFLIFAIKSTFDNLHGSMLKKQDVSTVD